MEGGSTDVLSTPRVLLDRDLKKVTIGLAIRGEILVGRACARTSTFTCLKTNWKPSLFEYKSRSTYESNNIDWALLNADTSILHHAFISIFIALWAVITRYVNILMATLYYFTRFNMKM